MTATSVAFAKLAGILRAITARLDDNPVGQRPIQNFSVADVGPYFDGAARNLAVLREELFELFGDYPDVAQAPDIEMASVAPGVPAEWRYSRNSLQRLARRVDEILEIRAHSELATPASTLPRRAFISHGNAKDWYEVQAHVERDLKIGTLELAQEASRGMTILGKLAECAGQCDAAIIVMTGDDETVDGQLRARENVIHEIGYFQAKYGLSRVVLLHENGVNVPSNIQGVVYIPFPKNQVSAGFGVLDRELRAMDQKRP